MLNIAEELLLIALDDQSGKLNLMPTYSLDIALSGALLMELVFKKRVAVTNAGVSMIDKSRTGDRILDYAMSALPTDKHTYTAEDCLKKIAGTQDLLKTMLCQELVSRNILKKTQERYLWVFTNDAYISLDGREEASARQRIRDNILDENKIPTSHDIILIGLLAVCNLHGLIFNREELALSQARIDRLKQQDVLTVAVMNATEEVHEAIAQLITAAGM